MKVVPSLEVWWGCADIYSRILLFSGFNAIDVLRARMLAKKPFNVMVDSLPAGVFEKLESHYEETAKKDLEKLDEGTLLLQAEIGAGAKVVSNHPHKP